MNITFVGCGNVALILARLCTANGHIIKQVIARNATVAQKFAADFNCLHVSFDKIPDKNIDLVIVALSDISMPEAVYPLNFGDVAVVHTAGACDMDVIKTMSTNYGVLYPLQSLRKEMEVIPEIPFLIEGSSNEMLQFIKTFAESISKNVAIMHGEERLKLHAAAVIVNNFTNYLFSVAEKYCADEGVNFKLLLPLIKQTADIVQNHSPLSVQTGPANRGDITTLEKHLRLLTVHPKLRTLYMRLSDGIMNG
jgi:predicted short-subunit dehydrogenase-like oxidoreductase (DUF2520 family)